MLNFNILQNILYRFHLLLNVKKKYLLTTLLQILFVLYLTNLYDHTYCMTNESDSGSEISDISDISDIFHIDEAYIQHCVEPHLEYYTEKYKLQPEIVTGSDLTERSLGPIFEYLKTEDSQYIGDSITFDTKELSEKVSTLQKAYFTESIENSVLKDAITKQEAQLISRHQDLINAKFTIKHLERDIETLRKQVEDILSERK